jgi:hypothetical protein
MRGYNGNGAQYGALPVLGDAGKGGLHPDPNKIYTQMNSGGGLIHLLRNMGAKRIMLLGYDFGFTHGKAHWHGDHPRHLGNAGSMKSWFPHMNKLAEDLAAEGVKVINCSRHTALECFKRMPLKDALTDERN